MAKKRNRHFQHVASASNVEKMRMTDKKHRQIEKRLIGLLDGGKFVVVLDGVGDELRPAIIDGLKRSVVGPTPMSSGIFPVPQDPPVWGIGCYGSVWTDLLADGVLVRVSWHEQKPNQFTAIFPPKVDAKTLLGSLPDGIQLGDELMIVSDSPEAKKIIPREKREKREKKQIEQFNTKEVNGLLKQVAQLSTDREYTMLTLAHWANIIDYQYAPQIQGADSLEALLLCAPATIMTCYDRFTETFQKKPKICASMVLKKSSGIKTNDQYLFSIYLQLMKHCVFGSKIEGCFTIPELDTTCTVMIATGQLTPDEERVVNKIFPLYAGECDLEALESLMKG